jgi:hypothetical protein
MSAHDETEMKLERYLSRVRAALRGLPPEQVTDILRELRSHVQERAGDALAQDKVQAALDALGDPEQLAGQYVTQNLFDRAAVTRSPMLMLQSLFHWATLSLQGFAVALVSLFLYMLGATCLMMAIAKPFDPDRVGLWVMDHDSGATKAGLQIYVHGASMSVSGHDLLGWWIVPLGLVLGLSIIVATYRFDLQAIKSFRRHGPARP